MTALQIPTVGRAVHYHSLGSADGQYPSVPRAATITHVEYVDDEHDIYLVSLAVFNPTGLFFNENVMWSWAPEPGKWTWPPKVGAR